MSFNAVGLGLVVCIAIHRPGPGADLPQEKAKRGLEFELDRFRCEDGHPAFFPGHFEESRNSAGLRVPLPHGTPILTK
ncbi:MAG: hypothetical protein OXF79_28135 [Chloroflexi bacterium]|nr:hypothetical protein [Chloroflexota bacterium]